MHHPRTREEDWRPRAREALIAARARVLALLEGLSEETLCRQHSPLMSPLVWDLAHIANYEEQWLLRALGAPAFTGPDVDAIYDAFRHPRAIRAGLPLLRPAQAFDYAARVREEVLRRLEGALPDGPLLEGGFVFGMVAQHEQQHAETLCATLQLMRPPLRPRALAPTPGEVPAPREVLVPGGEFPEGSDAAWAYDNERPRHRRALEPFFIDAHPVINRAYLEFIADGGYDDPRLWSEAGWAHRQEAGLTAPQFWERRDGVWLRDRFGFLEEVPPAEPVQHVCWFEAEAFARWARKRLPTEAEWERAASWSPDRAARTFPWGEGPWEPSRANLGQRHFGPSAAGSHPAGASALGVEGLLGDVWEWTASDFLPYPGFRSFPYAEYSEVFFGAQSYKVLRGGSWATAPVAIRNSFRNWDFPIRRQIFAGFRLARDAER